MKNEEAQVDQRIAWLAKDILTGGNEGNRVSCQFRSKR